MPQDKQYLDKLLLEWRDGLDRPRLQDAKSALEETIVELDAKELKRKIRRQYCEED